MPWKSPGTLCRGKSYDQLVSLNVKTSYQLGTTGWARYKAVLMHCQEVVVNVQHHMIFNDIFKNFTYKTGEADRSLVGCL